VFGLENIIMAVSALGAKLTIVREVMHGTGRRILYDNSEKNEIRVYGNTRLTFIERLMSKSQH